MATEVQLGEVLRLAVAGGESVVAVDVAERLGAGLLGVSRFREVVELMAPLVDWEPSATVLDYTGQAHQSMGELDAATVLFERSLAARVEVGDRSGQAGTLNNIGMVHDARGELDVALNYYGQALPIQVEVGDRSGQAVTRYNIAMVLRAQGHLDDAVTELQLVVELDAAVQHPDLEADTAMLHQVQAEREALS